MNIDVSELKPNSHKHKAAQQAAEEEKKKIEKVVTGEVKTKKRGEISKLAGTIISEDAKNVKSYIFSDILLPALKKSIFDIVTGGIDMILYGGRGSSGRQSTASKLDYRKYYDRPGYGRDEREPRAITAYSYDDIILSNRGEAEDVLDRMNELIDTYGVVSVADLYDLVGLKGKYTDNNYGWTNISNAEPVRTMSGGYMLRLPKVLPLK